MRVPVSGRVDEIKGVQMRGRKDEPGETRKRRWLSYGRRGAAAGVAKASRKNVAAIEDEQQALLFLMWLMLLSDGEASAKEFDLIMTMIYVLPILRRYNTQEMQDQINRFQVLEKSMGLPAVGAACIGKISKANYPGAYAAVVEVAVADGVLEDREMEMLDQLKGAFKLEAFTFQAIEYSARIRYQVPE